MVRPNITASHMAYTNVVVVLNQANSSKTARNIYLKGPFGKINALRIDIIFKHCVNRTVWANKKKKVK